MHRCSAITVNLAVPAALFCFTLNTAFGDLIVLNNRQTVEGEVVSENDKSVTIRLPFGTDSQMTIPKSRVKSIQREKDEGEDAVPAEMTVITPAELNPPSGPTNASLTNAAPPASANPAATNGLAGGTATSGTARKQRSMPAMPAEQVESCMREAGDPDPEKAASALRTLADSGADSVYPLLLKAIESEHEVVRSAGLSGLIQFPEKGGIAAVESVLLKTCSSNPPLATASALISALEIARSPTSVSVIGRVAENTVDPDVRRAAIWSLGKMEQPEAYPMVEKFANDPDGRVREAVACSLGRIAPQKAVPVLIRLLGDTNAATRVKAAQAIESAPDPSAVPALIAALTDNYAGPPACIALGKLKAAQALPRLTEILHSEDAEKAEVRIQSARALGMIGDASVIKDLVRHLKDSPGLANMCAYALTLLVTDGPKSEDPKIWLEWAKKRGLL